MLDRITQWVLKQVGWCVGFRTGLAHGARRAKSQAATTVRAARTMAGEITTRAQGEAGKMVTEAREQAAGILEQARIDGHREGYDKGYSKGKKKGTKEGRETGRRDGWNQVAIEYGIAAAVEGQPVPCPNMDGINRDMKNRVWANIYQSEGKWTVRVLIGGERFSQVFRFKGKAERERPNRFGPWVRTYVPDRESQMQALVEALRYRNSLVSDTNDYQALFTECIQYVDAQVIPEGGRTPQAHGVEVALEFHRRLQSTQFTYEQLGFLGEDPEDRLNIEDTALLNQPWTVLFTKVSSRLGEALHTVGLGTVRHPRSVRDLLLVTPAELLQVMNFGPHSLDQFRRGLQHHGLALWGDPVPEAPRPDLDPGTREFRAITLD